MAARRRVGIGIAVALVAAGAAVAGSALWARRRLRAIADAPDPHSPDDLAPLAGDRSTITGHDGVPLHVVDAGQGTPIVLVHGFTASNRFWALLQRHLTELGHRVVAFDQRGHGRSGIGSDGVSVEALGRDLATVLESLDLRDAVVAGHSLGGVTVLSLLVNHPDVADERVRHAVVACSLSRNRPEAPLVAAVPGLDRLIGRDAPDAVATLMARNMFGVDTPPASLIDLSREILAEHDPRLLAAVVRGMGRWDLRPGLADVTVPVTVVAAGHDRITPPRYSRELADLLPASDERWFTDAGHLLPWELPEEFAAIVAAAASAEKAPTPTA